MKTKIYNTLKKYDRRKITFHGKLITQYYNGKNWITYNFKLTALILVLIVFIAMIGCATVLKNSSENELFNSGNGSDIAIIN
jgi:hypothetical protein